MEIWAACFGLRLAVCLVELSSLIGLGVSVNSLRQRPELEHPLKTAEIRTEASAIQCTLQGTPRVPAFSKDGDFVIGGVFSIHFKLYTVIYNYTTKPDPPRCTGRLVGGREKQLLVK